MIEVPGLILDDLERHSRERSDEPAIFSVGATGEKRALSWSELSIGADAVARRLIALGVKQGEPVAFQLPNRPEFVQIALGTLRIGAVCEPLMPIFREHELSFMLRESRARVLFVPARFRGHDYGSMAKQLQASIPSLEHVVVLDGEGLPADTAGTISSHGQGDQVAQLLFTSGTSGEPKGVLHRHDVLMRAADLHIRHFGLTEEDVVYVPSPLAHQTGFLYGMWIALRLGVPQLLQEVWDGEQGLGAVNEFGATFVQAATPFLSDLVAAVRDGGEPPRSLRTFVATGAAIPRGLARESREMLGAEVGGAWGTTETCLGTAFAPGDPPERAWSTDGRALEGVKMRIVDDAGAPQPAGASEEGNFEVDTGCMFAGYLNRPELTAEAMTSDGFYRTGDLARIDSSGYVRITGRVKDVINRGGEKIPVAEVEQLLYRHPAVREAAIVAMPDARLGERACAYVVLQEGAELDFADMQHHLEFHRVTKTYWPERLELVERLPRTASGKIQKYVLRDRARESIESKLTI